MFPVIIPIDCVINHCTYSLSSKTVRCIHRQLCRCFSLFCFPLRAFLAHMSSARLSNTHTHTCIHDYKARKKRPYCVQQSICLLQLSNFEDDVRMWQSPLYPPACFITGVIHTKRKCVCAYQCVCVCAFAFSAWLCFGLQTTNNPEVWGLLSHWCNYHTCRQIDTQKHTRAHHFHPITLNHTHWTGVYLKGAVWVCFGGMEGGCRADCTDGWGTPVTSVLNQGSQAWSCHCESTCQDRLETTMERTDERRVCVFYRMLD